MFSDKVIVLSGTHTKPYGFGTFPKVATTHKVVDEDPCQLYIYMKQGKQYKVEIDREPGSLVGPPGYYLQMGGKMNLVEDITGSESLCSGGNRARGLKA